MPEAEQQPAQEHEESAPQQEEPTPQAEPEEPVPQAEPERPAQPEPETTEAEMQQASQAADHPERAPAEEDYTEDTAPSSDNYKEPAAPGTEDMEAEDEQQGEFHVMDSVGGDSEAPEADQGQCEHETFEVNWNTDEYGNQNSRII